MDARIHLLTAFLVLISVMYSTQAPADNSPEAAPVIPCVTGKGLNGNCILRAQCSYGTPAIDKLPYAPKGYKRYIRTCSSDRECCPFDSILEVTTRNPNNNYNFKFDEND